MLKQEGLWTIRTGDEVRVFTDPWIYANISFKVEGGPIDTTYAELRVRDLIGPDRTWNETKVQERMKDQFIWPHSKDEKTHPKSVYHRLRDIQATLAD